MKDSVLDMVFVSSCCQNKFSSLKQYKPIMFLFCRPEDWVGSAGHSGSLKGEIRMLDGLISHLGASASELIQVVRFMLIFFLSLNWGLPFGSRSSLFSPCTYASPFQSQQWLVESFPPLESVFYCISSASGQRKFSSFKGS